MSRNSSSSSSGSGPGNRRAATRRPEPGAQEGAKRPFSFEVVLARIRSTLKAGEYADAAMFDLATQGYRSLFEQLIACIISIRTRDEVSLPTAKRLFDRARTPEKITQLSVEEIDELISASTFHEPKARQIHAIAQRTVEDFDGALPCDFDVLTSFSGVGPKCANLALGVACGHSRISVDIHVHRITNRWGVVQTRTPEQTMAALEEVLPEKYWLEINRLLVPFGKHVCTGVRPKCSTCPVIEYCRQVGVTDHR
jgi:endonuclease III